MAATGLQRNWTAVAHGAIAINRVNNVAFSQGGTLLNYSGDTDDYDTVVVKSVSRPTATVTTGNTALAMGLAVGTTANLTATHKDAKGATGGDIIYTLANAVVANTDTSGAHAAFGTANIHFQAYSPDGTTNPLSFSRA